MERTRITDKKRFTLFILATCIVIGSIGWGGYKLFKKNHQPNQSQDLSTAAKTGEQKIMQVLVQIYDPKGDPETVKGSYQRGDIIQLADENKEWSPAEEEGFLIIKVKLTQAQADMLTQSLEKDSGQKDDNGRPVREQLQLRRFAVDLAKIGIAPDQQQGKVIGNKVFDWKDIIKEKTN